VRSPSWFIVRIKAGSPDSALAVRVATARKASVVTAPTEYVKSLAVKFTSSMVLRAGRSSASAKTPCSIRYVTWAFRMALNAERASTERAFSVARR
jgi:hypothetical protein